MSTTGLAVFDETVHKTNTWLKEISQTLGSDRHRAYQALRAVLLCLRDRLTIDEATHLGARLASGWKSREDPLARRLPRPGGNTPRWRTDRTQGRNVRGVPRPGKTCHSGRGQRRDPRLPQEIRTLWPQVISTLAL